MNTEYILHWTLAINRGWTIKPTARSETARLDSKIFSTECKEDVFHIVIKIAEFPIRVVQIIMAVKQIVVM